MESIAPGAGFEPTLIAIPGRVYSSFHVVGSLMQPLYTYPAVYVAHCLISVKFQNKSNSLINFKLSSFSRLKTVIILKISL